MELRSSIRHEYLNWCVRYAIMRITLLYNIHHTTVHCSASYHITSITSQQTTPLFSLLSWLAIKSSAHSPRDSIIDQRFPSASSHLTPHTRTRPCTTRPKEPWLSAAATRMGLLWRWRA